MPIIIRDMRDFLNLRNYYNEVSFVIMYCDPKSHGYQLYNKLYAEFAKARRNKQMKMLPKVPGETSENLLD